MLASGPLVCFQGSGEQSIENTSSCSLFVLRGMCVLYVHIHVHVCTHACRAQKSAVGYPPSYLTFETRSLNLGLTNLPSLVDQWASRYLPFSASPAQELRAHTTMFSLLCGHWGSNSGPPNLLLLTQNKKLNLEVSRLTPPKVLRWPALPAKEAGTLTAPTGMEQGEGRCRWHLHN